MEAKIEKHFQELFGRVSSEEVERNSALCRQTEKLRRILFGFKKPETMTTATSKKVARHSLLPIAGEYALLK